MWHVVFTRQAAKDAKRLKVAGLDAKAKMSAARLTWSSLHFVNSRVCASLLL